MEQLGLELTALIEDPDTVTVALLLKEALAANAGRQDAPAGLEAAIAVQETPGSVWVSRSPVTIKLRLFLLPYAGGVSENVFARWANLMPACIQICPVEIPGRGRRSAETSLENVANFADILIEALPLQDKPYALFGTCLGAIVAYEVAQRAVARGLPAPKAFFPAAVSPPHLYAQAVMKLYLADGAKADAGSMDTVIGKLRGWRDLPRELLMMVFEKGNFAGLEEMKKNERLFNRVAPMGVNDILMAVQYRHVERAPLAMPVVSFEGLLDGTIDPNNMAQWQQYAGASYRNVPIMGDHYFVSSHFREVAEIVTQELLDVVDNLKGGILGESHSWV